jgi:hypothetical protein
LGRGTCAIPVNHAHGRTPVTPHQACWGRAG